MKNIKLVFLKNKKKLYVSVPGILGLIFISIFLGGLIAELIVRECVFFPSDVAYMRFRSLPNFEIPESVIDSDLFWKSSQEFRNVNYNADKKEGVFRLICLGDSVTQSHGLDGTPLLREQTYVYKLEKLLNENWERPKFELINAGVGGYSSLQGLRYLELRLLQFNPDLIISWFGINDDASALFFQDKEQHFYSDLKKKNVSLLDYSKLWFFLRNEFFADKIKRVSLEDFYENSKTMLELARKNKFKIAFVIPFRVKGNKIEYISGYKKALEKLRNDHNCILLDVGELLGKNGQIDKFFIDGVHATEEGNEVIARIIFELINNYKLASLTDG